ncbi:murein hydrolase activator EnvC family protein [Metabacillus malikii]|uniref:Peptidoglycan hydrolase CwlO-like protein n=1 Tax=Metabacillus malikii TaxID=1504265 RepID=A0ABT9ZIW3_9BACI|nr:peptidoglycan DD-metalloendopeptidase family protein [Metabacillus malikii]MDQ0231483.1 peptidoglycan hydrolase CwlO-like protein [Metabacillus malikii]
MNRRIVILGLATVLGTSGLLLPSQNLALAQTLQEKKQEIQEKQSDVTESIDQKENEITSLEKEKSKLNEDIATIDAQVSDTSAKIREKKANIEDTNKNIEKKKAEIETIKERIAERNKLLEDRARSLQETGGMISYLEVLLGAQNFGDFVGRVNAVSAIVEADRDILKAHEDDKTLLEQTEADLTNQLKTLETSLADLQNLESKLTVQAKQKQELMKKVEAQQEEALHHVHELEDEAAFLEEQKKAIELEEQRQREAAEAAKRAAAEEARKQAEAQKAAEAKRQAEAKKQAAAANQSKEATKQKENSSSSSSSSAGTEAASAPSTVTEAPASSSGSFMWPASGRHSSEYGYRTHPITGQRKLHGGIDIANSADVPVVAAASGTVIRSHYSSSYGNVVYITHNINGQVYTTLYAHLETRYVSTGDSVSKGQQIGIMGNTGHSTGQHLHFEIHKGPWNGTANAVNPRNYLP